MIYGSGMADPTAQAELQASACPRNPDHAQRGAIFVNGSTTLAGIYYATATQIAAVLPSSTPTGTATITVKYNGTTSAAFNVQVVKSALGFDTLYGTGTGLGVATEGATVLNYNQSAKPGDTVTLWGSGLGATTDSDTVFTSSPAQSMFRCKFTSVGFRPPSVIRAAPATRVLIRSTSRFPRTSKRAARSQLLAR